MYTKLFRSIYDGTLVENWKALVTFQQLLILAEREGVVDKSPKVISGITHIPVEIILEGITILEGPDPESRTPDMEGRRIVRLDEHREWGWFIVNFEKYRLLMTRAEKNEKDLERVRAKRAAVKVGLM